MTPLHRRFSHGTTAIARAALLLGTAVALAGATPTRAQDSGTPPDGKDVKPKVTVEAYRRAVGPDVLIKGRGFTPNGQVRIVGTKPPGAAQRLDFGIILADSTGAFVLRREEACTAYRAGMGTVGVQFTVTDVSSNKTTAAYANGGAWVCTTQ